MPIISLDEVPSLITRHPRHVFLVKAPQDVLPPAVHSVLGWVKVSYLWQLLTFSSLEISGQMLSCGIAQPDAAPLIRELSESLIPHGLGLRENAPFAVQVEQKPPVYVKSLSDTAKSLTPFYADATYYWNRWQGFQAQAKFSNGVKERVRLVFRSESLKLGYDITR
jgi:hypothetical protein